MKAPDKIYMPNELLSEEWCRHIEGQDTEYIRKDALLELINKKLQESADRLDYRMNKAYAEILDKLNEM